jgi:hypothetical protein
MSNTNTISYVISILIFVFSIPWLVPLPHSMEILTFGLWYVSLIALPILVIAQVYFFISFWRRGELGFNGRLIKLNYFCVAALLLIFLKLTACR